MQSWLRCHDTQYNEIQHNDTQDNDAQFKNTQHSYIHYDDTQHNNNKNVSLGISAADKNCCYVKCRK
jgi:hypothetical protein